MWYVRDVLYAVLYVRVSCFVVRGCGVSRRYIDVCYCDMFSVVNVYLDHLKFYVVCIKSRWYVCCSECDVVSNECNEHLLDYTPSRLLRSSEDKQLVVIKTHSHYGDISFQVAAAKLWNAAPLQLKSIQNIDSFKSKLKTYLFMLNL